MSLADILSGARVFCEACSVSSPENDAQIDGYLLSIGVNLARDLEPGYGVFRQGYIGLVKKYSSPERLRERGALLNTSGFDWELLCRMIFGGSNES